MSGAPPRAVVVVLVLAGIVAAALYAGTNVVCGCAPSKPKVKVWPAISGTPEIGRPIRVSTGTWSNSDAKRTFVYKWQRCTDTSSSTCSNIAGATLSVYTVTRSDRGDALRAIVTATNGSGSSAQPSLTTTAVGKPFAYGSASGPYSSSSRVWPPANWAPFSSASPWNKRLPGYDNAALSPDSAAEIAYMSSEWPPHFTKWQVSNSTDSDQSSKWTNPVYWASSSDPTYTIRGSCSAPASATSCPKTLKIPSGAKHSFGSDGHLSVIQPDGHTEMDFWQVANDNPISGGGTLRARAYGALDINGAGCCGGSTAANQGLPGGQIRGPELAAGIIKHALSAAERCSNGHHVPPATGDGSGGCPNAPPIGARLQLKMGDAEIARLHVPAYQKTILVGMAQYGIYITDTGGSPIDLAYEPSVQYTTFGRTSDTVMAYLETQGFADPATISIGLRWSDFQVVSACYATASC